MTTEQPTIADVRALGSFLVSAGETALLLTFQGILRSHEEYRAKALASSTPPADDVREALMSVHYCPEHGDLLASLDGRDTRSIRCVEAHTVDQILGSVRPRGTFTDDARGLCDQCGNSFDEHYEIDSTGTLPGEFSAFNAGWGAALAKAEHDHIEDGHSYLDCRACVMATPRGTVTDADEKEVAVTRAYNEVTGADDEGWNPDRALTALNTLWDAAREARS